MSRSPRRLTQISWIAIVVFGLLPWALLTGGLVLRAIASHQPLTMSVAAWMVLLVPLWVMWFAASAWSKRDETAIPAVVMAAPVAVVMALFLVVPAVVHH